jgi:hypothetical protein
MCNAPSSASAAEDMTALMICAMVNIASLFHGTSSFLDRKTCSQVHLGALVSDRYEALLCSASIMLLD